MEGKRLRAYAGAILDSANLSKGGEAVICADAENYEFAEMLVRAAFERGASDARLVLDDERAVRARIDSAAGDALRRYPEYLARQMTEPLERGAVLIKLMGGDPRLMDGADPARVKDYTDAYIAGTAGVRAMTISNKNRWVLAAVPSLAWAERLFPEMPPEKAKEALWNTLLSCAHMDEPGCWQAHAKTLDSNAERLNSLGLQKLRLRSLSSGTDLTVRLCRGARWGGGVSTDLSGVRFCPNIPSEEIYSVPHRDGVDGVVYSTMPVSFGGAVISGIRIVFKDGVAIEYSADSGREVFESIIGCDENSCRLGEVALLPYSSPIRKTGLIFEDTLLDENASCHVALGAGIASGVSDPGDSREKLLERGMNFSGIHFDFMFGTPDMECTGIREDGQELPIMKNGEFVF